MYFAIAGSSGCGKSTIINVLIKENENLLFIPSYTSRKMREGEVDGKTYTFITKEEFKEKIKEDEFLEYELIHENYYGNSRKVVQNALAQNKMIIKDVDVNGVKNLDVKLKEICPLIKIFFVVPKGTLKKRLINRGEKDLKLRLKRYKYEQSHQNQFDYILINGDDDKEKTLAITRKIVEIGNDYKQILPTEPVSKFNQKKFTKYFEKLKSGEILSPCKVALKDGNIYIIKGHEKFVAGMLLKVTVPKKFVDVKEVTKLTKEEYAEFVNYIETPMVDE
ncbi:MAG: ATP-binding cassette domain-containing protein [Clostridia bacterium]|nr:ATP-binding cassette domain-containing protein [Clostridia bacterium]